MTMLFIEWEKPGITEELEKLKELIEQKPEEKEPPKYVDPSFGF